MLAKLSAYGPNQTAWSDDGVALGCRQQVGHSEAAVLADPAGRIALCANVRLDDRLALCDALGVAPAERASTTDAALLLYAYRRWGQDCPERLSGDYAFAVWDAGRLFCARDYLGVRPFYYAQAAGRFAFASSVEAVLAIPDVPAELDEEAVAMRLLWAADPRGRHIFRAVRRLAPGHTLTVDGGKIRTARYWRPETVPHVRFASPDDYAQALGELLERAVEDRLPGGPIGVHLSGGLDSSAVAALAARQLRRQGRPPPLGFSRLPARGTEALPRDHEPEYAWLDAVARQAELRVLHCPPSSEDLLALLRGDSAWPRNNVEFSEVAVQRSAAEQHVRVLLTGILGDEFSTSSGFWLESRLLFTLRWGELLSRTRSVGMGALKRAALGLYAASKVWWKRRIKRHGPSVAGDFVYTLKIGCPLRNRLLQGPGFCAPILQHNLQAFLFETQAAAGALRGVEYRHPMADRRVVEFALGVPPELFRRSRTDRWLAREALRPIVPAAVLSGDTKHTPALYSALRAAQCEALPIVLSDIRACRRPLARARYVSRARTLAALEAWTADCQTTDRSLRAFLVAGIGLLDFWDSPCEDRSPAA